MTTLPAGIPAAILTEIEHQILEGIDFAIGDYEFEFVIDKVTDNQARGTVYLEDWDRLGENDEVMQVVLEARVVSTTTRTVEPTASQEDAAMNHYGNIPPAEQKAINARIHAAIDDGR